MSSDSSEATVGRLHGETPRRTPDHSPTINKALAAKGDMFVANHFDSDAVSCPKKAYDLGLMTKVSMLVSAWTTYELAMGIPEAAA